MHLLARRPAGGTCSHVKAQTQARPAASVTAGYHPTRIGEKFKDGRYTVMHKLGQGHYSIVWMVRDEHTGQQAAMKVRCAGSSGWELKVAPAQPLQGWLQH